MSVIIATRERPVMLEACVRSVLGCAHDSFEVVVVDQSAEPASMPEDGRLLYLHRPGKGKSTALNVGIAAARGGLLAFTDDDCTVPPDWLSKSESVFARQPEVAMAFGNLTPMEHDPSYGFVPPADHGTFRVISGSSSAHIRGGAGGDLVARRSLFDAIGGFDEQIGPGSRYVSCEEYDLYYRALASGACVALTPEFEVIHWGIRPYADGSGQRLKRWYAYGEGVVIAKHLHLRDPHMLGVAVRITAGDIALIGRSLADGRLTGIGMLAYKLRGITAGLFAPVDRRTRLFDASPRSARRSRPSLRRAA